MSETPFRSPFAALVWKEWRESWWLLVLMVAGPAAWTIVPRITPDAHIWLTVDMIAALCVWGLAPSLAAGLFASERARGTDAFQHERPVERGTIWNAKLLLPALALASSAILIGMTYWLWPLEQWRDLDTLVPFILLITWFLSFISAVLCSVLLDRPVTAGAAGGILSFALCVGQFALFDHFMDLIHQRNNWHWTLFLCLLTLEAICLLWLSRVAYVRWKRD